MWSCREGGPNMKMKLIFATVMVAGLCSVAAADPVVLSTSTPTGLARIADTYHVLDNLTPGSFYDIAQGQWLAGGVTTLYKKYYISADLGAVKPITGDSSGALAMGGLRLYAGEWLVDRVDFFKTLAQSGIITSGLLKYTAIGMWSARDWQAGKWRGGPYGGFEINFR